MSLVRERVFRDGAWSGWDLPGGWLDPWAGGANVGVVEPVSGVNIGAGILEDRPFPTTVLGVESGVTYNSTTKRYTITKLVKDVVIQGFVTLSGAGELENCWVAGPTTEYTGGYVAMVEGPSTDGSLPVRWTTIAPVVASAYYDGVGRGITYTYCDIYDVCDGVRGFSTSVNGVRCHGIASRIHHLVQFRPDYANSNRAETHNDGVQAQGNPNGDDDDLSFDGCAIDARHSLSKGTLPATRAQIAAIMITPQASQGAVHMSFDNGWLYGGMYCVNAGSDTVDLYGGSSLRITNTRFERPGTNMFGDGRAPDVALAVDSGLTLTASGNTYMDNGAPVPATNA